jgi:polyisoprenoid-binding protein YceI
MSSMSKPVKILLALVAVAVVAGGAAYFLFWSDDAPDEVDLGDAVDAVEDGDGGGNGDGDGDGDGDATAAESVEGSWVVDTSQGSFDFSDSASGTYVGFRVNEEHTILGSITAVGRTPDVSGEVTIEGTSLEAATFTAGLDEITTDQSLRDNRVQGALGTSEFPDATFVLTEAVDLGDAAAEGGPVSVTATGDLTIKGVTQPITIDLQAQVTGSTLVVVGSTEITFADWGVAVPTAPVVASADDFGILEVQLLLTKT